MSGTTKFDDEGLPIPVANKKDTSVLDKDGLPIPKKKENAGSPVPSDSSPNQNPTEPPVGTGGSDPKQVTANYKNNVLTPKDIGSQPMPVGPPLEQISSAINNKGKNLSDWSKSSSDNYVKSLVDQHKDVQDKIDLINGRSDKMVPAWKDTQDAKDLGDLEKSEKYYRGQIQKSYDESKKKAVPEIIDHLKSVVGVSDWVDAYNKPDQDVLGIKMKSPLQWNPETHKLTPQSTDWVIKQVDDQLNKKGDAAINAAVSGDLDKKDRTYSDISKSVVDYLNTIPVQKKQKEYTDEFASRHPELKDAFNANKEVNEFFSKDKIADLNAKVNIDRDKDIVTTQHKYFGKGGFAYQNKDFVDIQEKYAKLVGEGKMTDEVARKQVEAELKQNPSLKSLNDNYETEIRKITEKTQKQFGDYLIEGLKKDKPKFTIYKDGTVGLAGMDEDKYKNLIKRYEGGLNDIAIGMGMDSNEAWQKEADKKAKSVGAFWGSVGGSMNDMASAFSKYVFNKTQWGAKDVRYYESQDISSPQIEQSKIAASWNWKGLESLKDPNFWLSKAGSMVPVIAGASAVGLATDGAGMPEYVGWLANAGLFTAQNGLSTYNQLLNTRDAQGNLLTEADASHYMSQQMSEDFLPNVLMMAVTSGTLFKAKNIIKPTIGGAIKKALFGTAEAQPFFTWQGYNDYSTAQEAQGKKTDFWDYMQSKDFKDNLINGVIVGGGLSLLHAPGQYMKSVDNWTKMVHMSEGEFKNLIPQNYALGQEFAGNGNALRDALKLHIFNVDPDGLNEEGRRNLADLKAGLLYSTNLERNIRQGNLDPKNITELYQAHNLALADQHDHLSEQATKEGNKSLSDIYSDKAKDYREQAKAAAGDQAKFHYLVNSEGHPIFLSDRSFKTLEQEGTIAKWQKDGTIEGVHKSDDPEFAQRYKEFVSAKDESTLEGGDVMDHAKGLIEENKDKLGVHYEMAKKHPEQFLKDVADQSLGRNADGSMSNHPNAENGARETYGDDIVYLAKVLYPLKEEVKPELEKTPTDQKEQKVDDKEITGEYKPQIRDDYFAKADFFTPEEKEKFATVDDAGKDKMIDDKRAELKEKSGISVINPSEVKHPEIVPLVKTEPISSPKTSSDEKTKEAERRQGDVLIPKEEPVTGSSETTAPPPPVVGPTEGGLHPQDERWQSLQKKDLSERVQKENAFTQTNRETVDKVIWILSQDAARAGRTWQAQAEFETNALHNEFFNADGTIKRAFNPTTEQLALIGIRLMDISGEAAVSDFNPNDDQQTARTAYLESEKAKAERLLSFGEAGRAFQFRQSLLKMGINGDIQIKRKATSAAVGVKIPENEEQFKQLSKSDQEKIKPIYDAFNNWKAEYEKENKASNKIDEKFSKEEFDKRIKAAVADALKEAKVPEKGAKVTKESSKKVATSLRSFADKFEKFGRADLPEGTQKSGFGPDIQKLAADAMRWIADKIENGDFRIPELISEAIGRFKGEDTKEEDLIAAVKDGLKEAGIDDKTLNAKTNREEILAKMKQMAKDSDVKAITQKMVDNGMVLDYLHDIAQRGESPETILSKSVEELSKAFPGLDEKTLRSAYLKEGAFTPDKSTELKNRIKKATQTFRDVTILQRDIEALEVGDQLYGADKEKKTTLISDYEKRLREEKDQLLKEKIRTERTMKEGKGKAERLDELDRRIADLNNHQKLWDKAKKGKGVDKELAEKREEIRKTIIKNGMKLETGSKDSRASKEKVIEAHNERINNLKGKISDLLNDDTVSDEDKKALRSVQSELNKMGVKVDAGELDDKIKKAMSAASKLHTSNITNLLTGRKAEILSDLKNLNTQLKKDNNSALQDIQLAQLKDREVSRKEEAERQLSSGDFDDAPKLSDFKKDEALMRLTRDRKKAEHDLAYQVDKYHKQNQGFWQRQITRLQRLQRANLISGIMTNGKVLIAGVAKPVADAIVRRTVGTLTTPVFKWLGLKGEREALNTDATIRSFEDSFKGMTQRQAAEKRGTTEKALETATVSLQAANDQLKALEGTPEHQAYKENEYTKAVNDFQSAQYEWAASALYDFISPNSWHERLRILQTGVSRFEESMGGYRGTTWADEKSKHAIGTAANKIIHTLEIFGRMHGAEKDISARQAFVEGFLKRASERIKAGEQLTPSKLEGIALQSFPDFKAGKYQDSNPVAEYIRKAEMELNEKGIGGKAVAFGLGAVTPVLKVPLNIEAEGLFKYTAGLPVAIGKTINEIGKALKVNDLTVKDAVKDFGGTMQAVREHMQSLPPEKRDAIIQYANKGAVGLAMALVAGSMTASGRLVFGGVYGEKNKKRRYLDADTGEMEELGYGEIALDGHKLGKFWSAVVMHIPPLMPAVMGSTFIQKYKDERGDEKNEEGDGAAAWDALSEVVRTAWDESALKSLGDIGQAPTSIFNSFTTQMAGKNISEFYDTDADGKLVERKADNVWEQILLRTGGRKFVPTKEDYEDKRGDKQDEKTDKAQQYKEGDPYYEKNQK